MRQGESLASVCTADAHLVSGTVTTTGRQRSITRHRFVPEGALGNDGSAPVCRIEPMGSDPAIASLEDIEVQITDAAPGRRPLSVSAAG
jgi:hypothetical protein